MGRARNHEASAARVRELLGSDNVSVAALARELGVTRGAVNNWKLGVSRPDGANLTALAARYGVSEAYVLGLEESEPGDSSSVALALEAIDRAREALDRATSLLLVRSRDRFRHAPDVPFGRLEPRASRGRERGDADGQT